MSARGPRAPGWTRRALIASLALLPRSLGAQRGRLWPAQRLRYADPATEFTVERLTDPSHAAFLPSPHARAVARRAGFLLLASERSGSFQAFRLDERSGEAQQLTEAAALDPATLTLLPDERAFCYFDGPVLHRVTLRNLKDRAIYRIPEGWQRGQGFSLSQDGDEILQPEFQPGRWRLRRIRTGDGRAATLLERSGPIKDPAPHPRADRVLYGFAEGLWILEQQGRANYQLPLPPGRPAQAFWSPDGKTVLYLLSPEAKGKLAAIREYDPAARTDRLVAETSQFACFAFNSDGSVFVGASANLASPHLLLLLRATRRELTLCEHRASRPAGVNPIFSPDSRRIYFASDRDGKPAVYRMSVERLVEPTDS